MSTKNKKGKELTHEELEKIAGGVSGSSSTSSTYRPRPRFSSTSSSSR